MSRRRALLLWPSRPTIALGDRWEVSFFNPCDYLDSREAGTTDRLDRLWRDGNPAMTRLLSAFEQASAGMDVVVCSFFNPFPPEWLATRFRDQRLVLGCIDDPPASYPRTVPALWAFDGAFYVSPSYSADFSMPEILRRWGCAHSFWWPLTRARTGDAAHVAAVEASWGRRDRDLIYIGSLYRQKGPRFAALNRAFGRRLSIHGRWPLAGFAGFVTPIRGYGFIPRRVRSLSDAERTQTYLRHRICINMHYSERRETGNMRLYEAPWHGCMQLCDKAAMDLHAQIFEPDVEAVYYDSIDDAIEKANWYLTHPQDCERIARAGFARVQRDYDEDAWTVRLLDWAAALPKRQP